MRALARVAIVAALGGLGLAAAADPSPAAAAATCPRAGMSHPDAAALMRLVNARRAAAGLPRVRGQRALVRAGRSRSLAMSRGARFAHDRLGWAGGRPAGQNLARARTARAAMQAMLRSAAHRRNIHDRRWRVAGVGAASDCRGNIYFTVNLATTPPRR